MTDGEEERPRTPLGALVPFGLGALAAAAVCGIVVALPERAPDGGGDLTGPTPPVVREPAAGTDVRVTVVRGRVTVENVGPAGTGALRLEFRPSGSMPADCGLCVWPRGLDPGKALTVRISPGGPPIRVKAVTEVPDLSPGDNEARGR
ncbi:hypothetical protein LO762_28645 [Actinocorallia sp. API 0066]|uniref:hypothetical protein n=1 Tax=Actinocorallia sp. API 0066 TaxID=2896846 RepID=UPI001E65772A|nr:hypothetical protein [Actinocorallia sp. API 0066]MCD0453121.1 hypothetical protein [Actinocorallia sp. API 0066]